MKTISFLSLIAAGILAASLAVPVLASAAGLEKIEKEASTRKEVCLAKNRMYGDIKEIDHVNGLVSFTNNKVDLKLYFVPAEIKELAIGDNITVEMGYYTGAFQEYSMAQEYSGLEDSLSKSGTPIGQSVSSE